MYKLIKDRGYGKTVNIVTDNKSIRVGTPNSAMIDILIKSGTIIFPEPKAIINFTQQEWHIEVSKDVANDIARLALTMKKPIRKVNTQQPEEKKSKEIDADADLFNILYGVNE